GRDDDEDRGDIVRERGEVLRGRPGGRGQMHIRTVRGLPAVDMRIVADHEDHGVSALHGGSELVESMRVHLCREPGGVAGSMVVEGEGAAVMLDADEPPGTGVLKLPRAICADGAAED